MATLRGTLVIGQSGGPTAVINASLAGMLSEARQHSEIERVYGLVNGIKGALAENLSDLTNEDADTIRALERTPGAALGSCRRKLKADDYDRLFQVLEAHDVRYFLYAGGNDSMDTCHRMREEANRRGYALQVMGVPKTIDNDLAFTDHCPGYGTAARFIAQTTQDTGLDLFALRTFVQVCITEIMGRNAGWLTAAAILGKQRDGDAPHLVYVPERVFDEEKFLSDVERVYKQLGFVSVAISEGAHDEKGEPIGVSSAPTDAFGHKVVALGHGVGHYLADRVTKRLRLAARCNRPGTIQRVSSAHYSQVDIDEAVVVGAAAVRQAISGDDGYMVTLVRSPEATYSCQTGLAKLADVANAERFLPDGFITPDGTGITAAFRDYALPLIGEPLPAPARLSGRMVKRIV
ncbi:MAG: 6-phosphofructokinase [Chloroflexi bacterium]|nr:6-phosphofructokinase [Chloroflexota bacterium]